MSRWQTRFAARDPQYRTTETTMIHRFTTLALVLFIAACSSSQPAKAPGTEPSDMSEEEHREEAAEHNEEADEHKAADDGKNAAGKAEHLGEAQEHRDVAHQHEEAADKAE